MNQTPPETNHTSFLDRLRTSTKAKVAIGALALTGVVTAVPHFLLGSNREVPVHTIRLDAVHNDTSSTPATTAPAETTLTTQAVVQNSSSGNTVRVTTTSEPQRVAHLAPGEVVHNTTTTSEPAHEAHLAPGEVIHRDEPTSTTSTTQPGPTTSTTVG